jgi:hypothetical protein
MTEPIECNLVENALDYLLLAGEQAQVGGVRMLKHAIATLYDGVELLLKARLELRDWSLVFKDVDQANRTRYEEGDFQSVTFDQAVKRLENICGLVVEKKHLPTLNELRQLRNRIRHFAVTTDRLTAISLITKTHSFALDFLTTHLEAQATAEVEEEMTRLRSMLGEFTEFVDARWQEIQSELDGNVFATYVDCPTCLQRAFFADGDAAKCLFCGFGCKGEAAAAAWVDRFIGFHSLKDSLIEPEIENCPECGAEACVNVGRATDEESDYVCFSCGVGSKYEHCIDCGQLHADDNPGSRCSDCWQALLDRND